MSLTSAQHAAQAEKLMASAKAHQRSAANPDAGGPVLRAEWAQRANQLMAEAQVHATLALAKKETE
jgi:hypothetical protein